MNEENKTGKVEKGEERSSTPSISLPKGGGAIRGIGEKFASNPVTGTGSLSVPIATSPGRSGFGPQLSLNYDSGSGNGPFGFGWNLSLPSITRKTDKGLPKYQDEKESDTFILSGAEDLVPVLIKQGNDWVPEDVPDRTIGTETYRIKRYRPRIEGLFARIERWTNIQSNATHWRSISRDNITTVYGRTTDSRIEDTDAPDEFPRVFSWLICESYDDKGNAIYYEYEPEDSAGIDLTQTNERNRTDIGRSANRYMKRIKYGNKTPVECDSDLPREFRENLSERSDWLFEVIFDYVEGHYKELPADPNAHRFVNVHKDRTQDWQRRKDPFSSFRSGFEVRTYRLCHRVLMFHRFPDELGVDDYLVRSTGFKYEEGSIASFIISVTQSGYKLHDDGAYLKKSLPPLEFEYSKAVIQDKVQEVDKESLENLPQGLDGIKYRWVDIDGEGSSGILAEQGGSWYYKRNISDTVARFAPMERLVTIPSFNNLSEDRQQLLDLAGDGQLDVVEFDSLTPGFYERTKDEAWHSFKPFVSLPNISWQDPNLKFVDLTGDGHADILITEDDAFTWYQSLAETGFTSSEKVRQALDEEKGPKLLLADGTQSIYLADLSGDGLTDLVRIRNGEVCYWPNLGYGRFGAKVTMDNSPHFDAPDQFDHRRIRLADIDGSGVTDIVYLKGDGVYIYLNESGNRWADAEKLKSFPHIDNLSSVIAVDLLGNGTACLVWSSPLPGHAHKPMRYIDLMGGQKPHLLIKTVNNLGAETHVHYAPSTRFYLADKLAGKSWITKLPFPVHVVERVETYDRISRNRFVTRYAYHHGYFDGVEREFRGFGMVEQWDTEEYAALTQSQDFPTGDNIEESSHVPPILTRTWFHTGAYIEGLMISRQFEKEYYREGNPSLGEAGLTDEQLQAMLLEDTILPTDINPEEAREAVRTLKGSILRQEIYSRDGTEEEDRPYTVSERNYAIKYLQPHHRNKYAVFFIHPHETIDFHYERKLYDENGRNLSDPRVSHTMTLVVDDYGNVQQAAAIGYGRRHKDPDPLLTNDDKNRQQQIQITYTENDHSNPVLEGNAYRTPLLYETRAYELLKVKPSSFLQDVTNLFRFEEMQDHVKAACDGAHDIPYKDVEAATATENHPYRRLIEHIRTLFRSNNLEGSLPLGNLQSLALPFGSFKLAFTPGLVSKVYGDRVNETLLSNEGRYVHSQGDNNWWIPSGDIFYSPDSSHTFPLELNHARKHFFLPSRFKDPFGQTAIVKYDSYDLLIQETRDALGNTMTAGERDTDGILVEQGNDYRVLQPKLVMDFNRNRSAVSFDALGLVGGTAIMGKPEENHGDSLQNFETDLTDADITLHLQDPFADPYDILQSATTRLVYDLFSFQRTKDDPQPHSIVVYTLARETHDADLAPGQQTKIQHNFSYSDGFGREIQKKIQAEPGPLDLNDPNSPHTDPRWVGSGWTIFNNKGKPVKQYEPFFDGSPTFRFSRQVGVSPILFYDPLQRVVATLHPNHTYEKVVFNPWKQETWDVNDTVQEVDPKNDADVGDFFCRLTDGEYLPTWYNQRQDGSMGAQEQVVANKSAVHANTPSIAFFDTLGRPFLTVTHNRFERNNTTVEEKYVTRLNLDIQDNQCTVIDAKDRIVMEYDYNIVGPEQDSDENSYANQIHQSSMEAGERWMLNDVAGNSIYSWNSRGYRFRSQYDELRRPTESFVSEGSGPEKLMVRTIYGETQISPEIGNLRGQVVKLFDQAGVISNNEYDFKGNLLSSSRQLAVEYKKVLNWSVAIPLEEPLYPSNTMYDALNRPRQLISPDNSEIRLIYNEANLLEGVDANLKGATEVKDFVTNINYDAKGQRTLVEYGNGVRISYKYDPVTFRLVHLQTQRNSEQLQDLFYTYDPAGNITYIRDNAQQDVFFRNHWVKPSADYTYDAIYRLIRSTGREHLGQTNVQPNTPTLVSPWDAFRLGLLHPGDGNAMGRYIQQYVYDEIGNILEMIHQGSDPIHSGWTQTYTYNEPSLIEPGKTNNCLTSMQIGSGSTLFYNHDEHGNMKKMPHLPLILWDFQDQLQATAKTVVNNGGTPETTFNVYDTSGQRIRKVTERQALAGQTPTCKSERIYLGGFEIYLDYNHDGTTVKLERETLHIMDNQKCIALVETRTLDTAGNDPAPPQLIRYQYSNHLGSANLELDDQAQIISYEEYMPYGSTSYQAVRSQTNTPKRYRYTGKERDEESGLYYHGARYYAPWLVRWTATDPIGIKDDVNLFIYVGCNPISKNDPSGTNENKPQNQYDWAIASRDWKALSEYLPSLSEGQRRRLLENATGNFKDRAQKAISKLNITKNQSDREIASRDWNGLTDYLPSLSENERKELLETTTGAFNNRARQAMSKLGLTIAGGEPDCSDTSSAPWEKTSFFDSGWKCESRAADSSLGELVDACGNSIRVVCQYSEDAGIVGWNILFKNKNGDETLIGFCVFDPAENTLEIKYDLNQCMIGIRHRTEKRRRNVSDYKLWQHTEYNVCTKNLQGGWCRRGLPYPYDWNKENNDTCTNPWWEETD